MSEHTYSTDGPICPYCGHLTTPDEGFFYDESLCDLECGDCKRPFQVRVYTQTSWTCRPA